MSKPSTLLISDWLFGGSGKHRLLSALLAGQPGQTWQLAQLARAAGLHPKGSVDVHVAALRQLGLVTGSGAGYAVVSTSPLTRPLRALLRELDSLADAPVDKPPL
jgi:hypothetical protein